MDGIFPLNEQLPPSHQDNEYTWRSSLPKEDALLLQNKNERGERAVIIIRKRSYYFPLLQPHIN